MGLRLPVYFRNVLAGNDGNSHPSGIRNPGRADIRKYLRAVPVGTDRTDTLPRN